VGPGMVRMRQAKPRNRGFWAAGAPRVASMHVSRDHGPIAGSRGGFRVRNCPSRSPRSGEGRSLADGLNTHSESPEPSFRGPRCFSVACTALSNWVNAEYSSPFLEAISVARHRRRVSGFTKSKLLLLDATAESSSRESGKTLIRLSAVIGPDGVAAIHRRLVEIAHEEGLIKG
jgi:hypothetical protein